MKVNMTVPYTKERIHGDVGKSLSFHVVVSSITNKRACLFVFSSITLCPKEVSSNSIIKCLKDNRGYGSVGKDNCYQGCHMVEEN